LVSETYKIVAHNSQKKKNTFLLYLISAKLVKDIYLFFYTEKLLTITRSLSVWNVKLF